MKLRLKVTGGDGPPQSQEWDLDADSCALVTVDVDVFRKDWMTMGAQTNVRFYDLVAKPAPPAPPERTPDCCVNATAGRSLLHVGDKWECDRGHRWKVTVPGRAEVDQDPPV